jgi:hypothetical protein
MITGHSAPREKTVRIGLGELFSIYYAVMNGQKGYPVIAPQERL